jgi:hypothetical protein
MKTMMRKFGMGIVIVMLMMKPLMMITRMRIRRTIINRPGVAGAVL